MPGPGGRPVPRRGARPHRLPYGPPPPRRGGRRVPRSRASGVGCAPAGSRRRGPRPARRLPRSRRDDCRFDRGRPRVDAPSPAGICARPPVRVHRPPAQHTLRQPQSPSFLPYLLASRTVFGQYPLGYGAREQRLCYHAAACRSAQRACRRPPRKAIDLQ